jgi:hypothetical protein
LDLLGTGLIVYQRGKAIRFYLCFLDLDELNQFFGSGAVAPCVTLSAPVPGSDCGQTHADVPLDVHSAMGASLDFKRRLSIDHYFSDDGFVAGIGLFFELFQPGLKSGHLMPDSSR